MDGIVVVPGAAAWLDIHSLIHGMQEWNDRGREGAGGTTNIRELKGTLWTARRVITTATDRVGEGEEYLRVCWTELVMLCFPALRQCVITNGWITTQFQRETRTDPGLPKNFISAMRAQVIAYCGKHSAKACSAFPPSRETLQYS